MRPVTSAMASWGWYAGTGITIAARPAQHVEQQPHARGDVDDRPDVVGIDSLAEPSPGEPGVRLAERPARLEPRVAERAGLDRAVSASVMHSAGA